MKDRATTYLFAAPLKNIFLILYFYSILTVIDLP